MIESGTDPESYITEYTLVYEDNLLTPAFRVLPYPPYAIRSGDIGCCNSPLLGVPVSSSSLLSILELSNAQSL